MFVVSGSYITACMVSANYTSLQYPTAQPRPNAETGNSRQPSSQPPSSAQKAPSPTPPSAGTGSLPPNTASPTTTTEHKQYQPERIQYCHYFSNFGKCLFEERNGTPCRFVHGSAPICQSGTACMRPRCMYTHPNMSGRSNFLAKNTAPNMNINPWQIQRQMMNPWWAQNMQQMNLPNPWNMNMAPQGSMKGN